MKILVIGCGRSGTTYASEVFNVAGLNVGHEGWETDGKVDWRAIANKQDLCEADIIFHQVRHPLSVISSFHTAKKGSWNFIYKTLNLSSKNSCLVNCMTYWLRWNELCESCSKFTYKVEDMVDILPDILSNIGKQCDSDILNKVRHLNTNENTRRHQSKHMYPCLNWDILYETDSELTTKIISKAQSYGYKV